MYRHTLIVIGKLKNRAIFELCHDYSKRLQRHAQLECLELKDSDSESEGRRIIEILDKRPAFVYALAEEGGSISSRQLANAIHTHGSQPVHFVIGGPYGLSQAVKERADGLLSLGAITLTHELARLILLEQLYRAASMNCGSKYHHD